MGAGGSEVGGKGGGWRRWVGKEVGRKGGGRGGKHTFMCTLREKRDLLAGWRRSAPWMRSRALTMRRSYWPSPPRTTSQSRVVSRRWAMFHSKPSCSLKNSRKAGSPERSASTLRDGCSRSRPWSAACFLGLLGPKRQIWARRPSTCLRPFLIFPPSKDDRLSKASDRSDSIVKGNFVIGGENLSPRRMVARSRRKCAKQLPSSGDTFDRDRSWVPPSERIRICFSLTARDRWYR